MRGAFSRQIPITLIPLRCQRLRDAWLRSVARRTWGDYAPRDPVAILRLAIHDGIITAADAEFAILAGQLQAMLDRATDGSEHERAWYSDDVPRLISTIRRLRRRT